MKRALLALIGLGFTLGATASPLGVLNAVRLHGCPRAAELGLVTSNRKLDAAAALMARGASLTNALTESGYLALHAAAIHILAPAGEADIGALLSSRYCETLTDVNLRELGLEQRGQEYWLLLAAPAPAVPNDPRAAAREVLDIVNAARASGRVCGSKAFKPTGALGLEPKLAEAALAHAEDMAQKSYFDHQGSDGSSPSDRLARTGYLSQVGAGENIAKGTMTPRQVAEGWLASPHHCENIMDPQFTVMNVAFAVNPKSEGRMYWAQEFATPAQLPPRDPHLLGQQVLAQVNAERAQARRCAGKLFPAAPPLTLDPSLSAVALQHSQDMAVHDVVELQGSDGSAPQDRLRRSGFKVLSGAELVAAGAMSVRDLTDGWFAVPDNCATLMDPRLTVMGVAAALNLKTRSLVFWTEILTTPYKR